MPTQSLRRLLPLGLIAWSLAAPLRAQELTVSAAASLTNAFQAVAQAFEKERPGVKVTLNFAASGPLLQQIRQGAPVDVFASADQDTMDRAVAAQLMAPGRVDFASNSLVLVVPANQTQPPSSLADLGGPGYRKIAVGQPSSVPVGRYTLEALRAAQLDAPLQPRFIYGDSVRQVLTYVGRQEVDAGFVYRTDALLDPSKVRIAFSVPTATPVRYPVAVVKASRQPALAQAFVDYLRSAPAQALLQGHGFSKP
ncbi:molybdate ABC transporter substrate-binding protein [Curvibacter sp. HBC61]|uniref:Molybdate ABC transporter substrate-binding protein n=1 Tax=Curvibacter cyanobacteriorum TaxID=3026422 RepID=A0ABT5N000_9BURK|nr:molybdate ABC transporter substrate-binding protein [Curvibacter sp. HBC61]MDD0838343.1 molybdate ABC transporter substrate-binding protein [Curvibacter sp. HBC61]